MENLKWGAKAFEQMQKLEGEVPDDKIAALVHVRAMGHRLAEMAIIAADARWPGFAALVDRLTDKEKELDGRVGQA